MRKKRINPKHEYQNKINLPETGSGTEENDGAFESENTHYHAEDYKSDLFFRFPQWLFFDNRYGRLSNTSKILYMYFLDRNQLSCKNNFSDENGNIYFIVTRAKMRELLNSGINRPTECMNELKSFGLIREKRTGYGKPNRIYLLRPANLDSKRFSPEKKTHDNRDSVNHDNRDSMTHDNRDSYLINKNDEIIHTEGEQKEPPAPSEKKEKEKEIFGEKFKNVRLRRSEYDDLVTLFGEDKIKDYVNRLDVYLAHTADTGRKYANHYATIYKWITEDKHKESAKPPQKKNSFLDFSQRDIDFDKIEKLERVRREQKLIDKDGDVPLKQSGNSPPNGA